VPFAAPPVGDLRWRPPEPHKPREGHQLATSFGPACPQTDRLAVFYGNIAAAFGAGEDVVPHLGGRSEDCLTLNIWTPAFEGGAALPVMVWIHGGSNGSGSSSELAYDGARLASRGVVLVSINYRVGPLGFFAHPALSAESECGSSGNYGLMDQVAALEWVRDNIAAFGGDPACVTVFGESSGALDLLHLMTAPRARGLFHRAIGQSGAPWEGTPSRSLGEAAGVRLVGQLGIENPSGAKALAALRAIDAEDLIRRVDEATGGYAATVIVDGWLLDRSAGDTFVDGTETPVPLLIGSNENEFSTLPYYLPAVERTVAGYERWVRGTWGAAADRLLELYPVAADPEVSAALIAQLTDAAFTCPARVAARCHARAGNPTYRYFFTRASPGPGGERLGAYHSMEVGYVFDTRFEWLPTEEADLELVEAMGRAWVAFAATGDPNVEGLVEWPPYDPEVDAYLELGDRIAAAEGVKTERCDALDLASGRVR